MDADFLEESIRGFEREIRIRDEKIIELETDNMSLHLKVAKLMSHMKKANDKIIFLNGRLADAVKERSSWKSSVYSLYTNFLTLQEQYESLRLEVETLPDQTQQYCHMTMQLLQAECLRITTTPTVDVRAVKQALLTKDEEISTLSSKLDHERLKRKLLHNTVMTEFHQPDLCIPQLTGTKSLILINLGSKTKTLHHVSFNANTTNEVVIDSVDEETLSVTSSKTEKQFDYERVFSGADDQQTVFNDVQPLITSLLDGYNVCVMAYGQTGSGKTHTMVGSHDNDLYNVNLDPHPEEGIIPRAVRELFRLIQDKPAGLHSVEISVLEIYNNEIRDLLSPEVASLSGAPNSPLAQRRQKAKPQAWKAKPSVRPKAGPPIQKCDVKMGPDGSMSVSSLTSRSVDDATTVMTAIKEALEHRCESATMVHEHSSRSHLIVMVTVTSDTKLDKSSPSSSPSNQEALKRKATSPKTTSPTKKERRSLVPRISVRGSDSSPHSSPKRVASKPAATRDGLVRTKLQLVDLAGSECVGLSGASGHQLRETTCINKSLCALSDVLTALANCQGHVPYRNSKLTHLLQDSIGGDAKLLLMMCVSPTKNQLGESLQTLGFGQRARQINRGQVRRRSSSAPTSGNPVVKKDLLSPQPIRSRSESLKALSYEIRF
ncbi:hypothetical protein CAPTEDRAFT_221617 [Capitella teleta]|uniref:Kinesin motor domain-containing protein n=1 Tax=Capitella teleta TaxID=283909 RepID=R7UY42_CAPTE|nr:hypothetical protein CAPTEDRAFT_221617 [Capitella teleta]|eukprot:ELU11503.1 hypothetical protein CAPTEDRAFT_221617 [Capitella teleta]